MDKVQLGPGDALIIVDVQNDFLPGGALPVFDGEEVIPVLNRYIARFVEQRLPVVATRDWHPANHCSFKSFGGQWLVHCVADTHGAAFSSLLDLPKSAIIVSKDVTQNQSTYSGFLETDLAERLRALNVDRLFIGGIATDYCVFHTVIDARAAGFQVRLLLDAVRAVDVEPDDGDQAIRSMMMRGAVAMDIEDIEDRRTQVERHR